MQLNATDLASRLELSKARISQYVASGVLDGCFVGDGRSRRFDLSKVAEVLGRKLDLGQMMGNGATTKQALREIASGEDAQPAPFKPEPPSRRDGMLPQSDPDRYELAKIQIAEEDSRRKRRDNERDEGRWVLADEVQRVTSRAMAQEIAQFETVLRDGARHVADHFGIDFKEVRKVMMDQWRDYRASRSKILQGEALGCQMTPEEREANV